MDYLIEWFKEQSKIFKKWLKSLHKALFFCIRGQHDYMFYYWGHEFPKHKFVGGTEGDKIKYCPHCRTAKNIGFCM